MAIINSLPMPEREPIHQFGDLRPLPWPAGAMRVFRVETSDGRYVATYADEPDAHKAAKRVATWRDGRVVPLSRAVA